MSYIGYDKPNNNDTCVAMCFFSPVGYQKPIANIQTVINEFKLYNIPFYVIELLYPGQISIIPNSITVHSDSIIFSKENLWNLLEKKIPDSYSKILFMDSDILYSKPSWFNDSAKLLETNDVIQCMEWSHKDIRSINDTIEFNNDRSIHRISFAKAIQEEQKIDLQFHHMGFCVGIRRDFFHKINGFFDKAITGYGDTLFWSCFTKDFYPRQEKFAEFFSDINEMYIPYRKNIALYYNYPKRVGYVSNCLAMHLYHGTIENRRYTNRQHYIPKPYILYYNHENVLCIRSENHNQKDLLQYWIDRKEDE